MIKIIQGEFFRARKSRLFWGCLFLSAFFVFSLALTFHYNTVKLPARAGAVVAASLNQFTEFLFSDYSLILPLTLFLGCYFTEDHRSGTYALLFSKGVSRTDLFFGKLIVAWLMTLLYLAFSFFMAYVFIFSMWAKQPQIDFSFAAVGGYLALQALCFCGYAAFLLLLSRLFRFRSLVFGVIAFLLIALYAYLTKISAALDLPYSLYRYWVAGLSHDMEISSYLHQLPTILITIVAYVLLPTALSFLLDQRADLRKLGRR